MEKVVGGCLRLWELAWGDGTAAAHVPDHLNPNLSPEVALGEPNELARKLARELALS